MANDESSTPARLTNPAAWTVILWFILLVFGGGCLASYFAGIGYFPRIAWEESLSYLGVLSIIGGSIVLAFGLLAFLPGVVWCEVLVKDCHLAPCLHYRRADETKALCVWKLSKVVGIPFGVLVVLMHIAAGVDISATDHPSYWVAGTMAPALALSVWIFHDTVSRAMLCEAKAWTITMSESDHFSSWTRLMVAFAASAVPSIIALLILEQKLISCHDGRMILMLSICSVVVVAANIVVAMSFATRRVWAVLAAAVATVFLLVVGERLDGKASLLTRIMQSYGVGAGTTYSLVVTSEGYNLLKVQNVDVEDVSGGLGRIDNAAILSRLGNEFFFRKGTRSIRLPAEMVKSWSRQEPDSPSPPCCCVRLPAERDSVLCSTP